MAEVREREREEKRGEGGSMGVVCGSIINQWAP